MSAGTSRSGPLLDLVCLSHLRWSFVFQRPQHLMTRCGRNRRVFFVEEPDFQAGIEPHLHVEANGGVHVVVPRLPNGMRRHDVSEVQRRLLDGLLKTCRIRDFVAWYYTPMSLAFTDHWSPRAVVYDCMDELSAFKDAPAGLEAAEAKLMQRASLVLTGGHTLYRAKCHAHHNVHPFPSSVDVTHFAQARRAIVDPPDQASIPHPRMGFMGVIDERMDVALIDGVAAARPDWQIVMVGPVVKIDPTCLPRRANVHFLGARNYQQLPSYLAGWDVALLPFARNEATRYISPTKTPEYLAAGKPVVSTSITDVIEPYGTSGVVRIADDVPAFVDACAAALADPGEWLPRADALLATMSWDDTWDRIDRLLDEAVGVAAPGIRAVAAGTGAVPIGAQPVARACSTISS